MREVNILAPSQCRDDFGTLTRMSGWEQLHFLISRNGDKLESILHRYIEGDNAFMAIHKQELKTAMEYPKYEHAI